LDWKEGKGHGRKCCEGCVRRNRGWNMLLEMRKATWTFLLLRLECDEVGVAVKSVFSRFSNASRYWNCWLGTKGKGPGKFGLNFINTMLGHAAVEISPSWFTSACIQ
jgi:hypothetical protein